MCSIIEKKVKSRKVNICLTHTDESNVGKNRNCKLHFDIPSFSWLNSRSNGPILLTVLRTAPIVSYFIYKYPTQCVNKNIHISESKKKKIDQQLHVHSLLTIKKNINVNEILRLCFEVAFGRVPSK